MLQQYSDRGWTAEGLLKDEWILEIDEALRQAIEAVSCGRSDRSCGIDGESRVHELIEEIVDRIENGRGFVVLREFSVPGRAAQELSQILLGFGYLLGMPVSQLGNGSLVGYVQDLGGDAEAVRGHQSNAELDFHCDRADLIGLLCVRPAREGGKSRLVSAVAVHNIVASERPDLLQILCSAMPHDLRDEERAGRKPWCSIPIFTTKGGRFVSRYIRRFVESTARFDDCPKLTARQVEALNFVDEVLQRKGVALDLEFRPGDLQFINNCTVWHSRTAFYDWSDPQRKRLLLRLWIAHHDSRALPDCFLPLYGEIGPGKNRSGVGAKHPR